ncbi:hypothetical protein EJ08DRAFT_6525 [Tothia fuscella]|uniref:Uncharacterized protein n=1 Tax=Tothia fuscella TaxID=1048955 RepID=A0A9P4U3I5_9PEZI|nr:hypothetical protein EJ08DRAFT_6525 [Tothia fuscella]
METPPVGILKTEGSQVSSTPSAFKHSGAPTPMLVESEAELILPTGVVGGVEVEAVGESVAGSEIIDELLEGVSLQLDEVSEAIVLEGNSEIVEAVELLDGISVDVMEIPEDIASETDKEIAPSDELLTKTSVALDEIPKDIASEEVDEIAEGSELLGGTSPEVDEVWEDAALGLLPDTMLVDRVSEDTAKEAGLVVDIVLLSDTALSEDSIESEDSVLANETVVKAAGFRDTLSEGGDPKSKRLVLEEDNASGGKLDVFVLSTGVPISTESEIVDVYPEALAGNATVRVNLE